jgi:hypothetical protein
MIHHSYIYFYTHTRTGTVAAKTREGRKRTQQHGSERIEDERGTIAMDHSMVESSREGIESAHVEAGRVDRKTWRGGSADVEPGTEVRTECSSSCSTELLKLSINLTDLSRLVSEQDAKTLMDRVSEGRCWCVLQMVDGQLEQLAKDLTMCREVDVPVLLVELEKGRGMERAVAALAGQLEEIAVEWTRKSGRYGGFKRFEGWDPKWRASRRSWRGSARWWSDMYLSVDGSAVVDRQNEEIVSLNG